MLARAYLEPRMDWRHCTNVELAVASMTRTTSTTRSRFCASARSTASASTWTHTKIS